MAEPSEKKDYKDRSRCIVAFGFLILLGGIATGLLAPVEMYCFYLFSEGGRFAYEGFGFGSFMFGNIASQIVGYYLIAAILIPLGYGHCAVRRWARTLSLTYLWTWIVVGAPLVLVVAFVFLGSKDLSLPAASAVLVFLGLSYWIFPGLLIRFYRGRNARRTFEVKDPTSHGIEKIPQPILVLSALFLFFTVMMHLLILFNGIFPVFGVFIFGLPGIVLIDISIACLLCLAWGTLHQKRWAWWGAVVLWGSFTISLWITFINTSYAAMLSGLEFPAREIDMLDGLPFQGFHFALLAGIPCLITWILAISSKRFFK